MHFLRISLIVLALFFAAPVIAFFAYDIFYFLPYKDQIKTIIAEASPEDREPPPLVAQLVDISEPAGNDAHLSRIVFHRLKVQHSQSMPSSRVAQQILWQQLIRLHFTEKERMALYCSLAYSGGNDPGLSAASIRLFNKPLSKLSAKEAATVVALLRGPSYYEKRPEALLKRRDLLLQQLGVGL